MINQSLIIASFINFFTCSAVAFYAFVKNPYSRVNRTWGILSFFVGIMCIGWGMIIASNNLTQANFWLKVCFLGGFFIPSAFLDFVYTFLSIDKRGLIKFSYLISAIFFILYLLGYTVNLDYNPVLGFYWWKARFLYHLYAIHLILAVTYGVYLLYKKLLISQGVKKSQVLYVLLASFLGFSSGSTALLPAYNTSIIPFGLYPFFLYPLIIAYAMVKYRLMDISIVIRKGLVYSITIGFFTGIYISAIFLFGQFLQGLTGEAYLFLILLSIIVFAIAFQPLKNHIQTQIDRLFFKDKYNYYKTLKELSFASASIIDLNALLRLISKTIVERIKIDKISIYTLDRDSMTFSLKESYIKEG